VPVSRLVDWVDQSHLYLHLEPRDTSRRKSPEASSRRTLRRLGIRTATALEEALSPTPEGSTATTAGLVPDADNRVLLRELRLVLNGQGGGPSVTTALLKTFQNDPNLNHVRQWKRDWADKPVPAPVPEKAPGELVLTGGTLRTNGFATA